MMQFKPREGLLEATRKIVIFITKRPKENIWTFVVFRDDNAIFTATVANLRLCGRDKPEGKAKELERKDGQILGQ